MVAHKSGAIVVCYNNNHLDEIFTGGDLKRIIQKKVSFNMDDEIGKFINKKPVLIDISETVSKDRELIQFNIDQLIVFDN